MLVNNTKRSPQHISYSRLSQLTIWECVYVWVLALFTFMQYFIQTVWLNVLVTHYGIRKLHSNTLRIPFPPPSLFWEESCLAEAPVWAVTPRSSWDGGESKKALDWDPHMQSLTLIINYGCFCFFLPQPFTTQLLAVGEREQGRERQREKAIFIKKN